MKKFTIWMMLLILCTSLFSIRNWDSYTNTTRIYDAVAIDNEIYLATWGGIAVYNNQLNDFTKTYTNIDGLTNNDVTALAYIESSNEVLIGTRNGGVNRMIDGELVLPLTEDLGLQSSHVINIVNDQNLIYIATDEGLSVFEINEEFPYPLLSDNYNDNNGFQNDKINEMILTESGYLIFACDESINYVHKDSLYLQSSWKNYKPNIADLKFTDVTNIGSKVAVSSNNGIYLNNDFENASSWNHIFDASTFASEEIFSILYESEDALWVSYGYWDNDLSLIINESDIAVTKIDIDNYEFESFSEDIFGVNMINDMKIIDSQPYFFSWGEGFFVKTDDGFEKFEQNAIGTNLITGMKVDQNGVLWIGDGANIGGQSAKGMNGVSFFDGTDWGDFNIDNSGILSNNIFRMDVDKNNNKLFGSWSSVVSGWASGISIFDNETWSYKNSGLSNNTISEIATAPDGSIYVGCSGEGVNVLDQDYNVINTFLIPSIGNNKIYDINFFDDKIFFGSYREGARIWTGDGTPVTNSSSWIVPSAPDLLEGTILSSSVKDDVIYFVSENGLYRYENESWYKYDISIKIQKWDNGWQVDERYIVDQERLFGSEYTTPSAIFVDPFGRVWIGSNSKGISVYNPDFDDYHNEFTNYSTKNVPLLSDKITAFAYDAISGLLYIGTDKGLNSVEIGKTVKTEENLTEVVSYPNPFYPGNSEVVRIENLPTETMPIGDNYCNIYDVNGDLVVKLEEDRFFQFSWNGDNEFGKKCSSGIYYYVVSTSIGKSAKGTIVLIR